jgi:hypothetical protein
MIDDQKVGASGLSGFEVIIANADLTANLLGHVNDGIKLMSARTLKILTTTLITLIILSGCAANRDTEKLAIWTRSLAASQADGPEILVFEHGKRQLIFIGVQHDSDPASSTHLLIASAFKVFSPRVVIAEGFPTSWGYSPARLLQIADEKPDAEGLLPSGETFPAVVGALRANSKLLGGEPEDEDVRRIATRLGVDDQDLLGFYVLRVVPQWVSQKKFDNLESRDASDLINRQLERSRKELGLQADLLKSADAWRSWRLVKNPRANPKIVDVEEAGPLADGTWPTSRIAASVSRARDTHLYELTKKQLNAHDRVMVIYGGSHALIQFPALAALLGKPCYRGVNAEEISRSCRTLKSDRSFRTPHHPS